MTNYHSILGVSPGCDKETIKKAYRKLALEKHPDKAGNTAESNTEFLKIKEAYEKLMGNVEQMIEESYFKILNHRFTKKGDLILKIELFNIVLILGRGPSLLFQPIPVQHCEGEIGIRKENLKVSDYTVYLDLIGLDDVIHRVQYKVEKPKTVIDKFKEILSWK